MSISLSLKSLFGSITISETSNESLMVHYAAKKDSKVLVQLYDNCADDLYHFLVTLSDEELAKEIAQRSWLKVIEKSHLYRQSGSFKSWLFTLARRTLIDEFRKLKRFDELHEDSLPIASEGLPEVKVSQEQSEALFNKVFNIALVKLPLLQKEAFCLQQEGFSLVEISAMTNAEPETVKSRLRYAKTALRKALENHRD